ncbi:hypothetical protein, partial [Sphingomonas sp. 10B4]|uniref:hypothetical protein n=1 Tax=Sphingomonas sp. 10B4 TaxID=3048575 RepID=UPI002B231095
LDPALCTPHRKTMISPRIIMNQTLRLAAVMLSAAENGRVYRLIYGSQLAFIRQLNSLGAVTMDAARQFFISRRDSTVTSPQYNFEAWLSWLKGQTLIDITGIGEHAQISLTPTARHFLSWMVAQGASDEKAL